MLRAVYTKKLSTAKNLAAALKNESREDKVSSGHTFYRDGVEVAYLYNYMSGPSRIETGKEHFLFKRKNAVVLFTQYYTLEHDGQTQATAKELRLFFASKSTISSTIEPRLHDVALKTSFWNFNGRRYRIMDGQEEIGIIEHNSDLGADIDLLPKIPLALQIFIYQVSSRMWQRGR